MESPIDASSITRRNLEYAALYRVVTLALKIGVAAALTLLAAGLVMNAFTSSTGTMAVMSVEQLASGLARFQPLAVMTLGVLVLLVTPAVEVLVVAVFCVRLRDRSSLAASLAILAVLVVSLILALRP